MDDPIQKEFKFVMNTLAHSLDRMFNGEARGKDRKTCFVLLIAPFDGPPGQRCNYISNGERDNIVELMKETVARFEAQKETPKP